MAFSKISDKFEDDEDERARIVARAQLLHNAAKDVQERLGCTRETLCKFQEVEEVLRPLLQEGGLGSLGKEELQTLLLGRLYQAVIIAKLEDGGPGRWADVKALVEDVLHFDNKNCHARWLRALALMNGLGVVDEAQQEMKRAVDCARRQGKHGEADQWEADLQRTLGGGVKADETGQILEKGATTSVAGKSTAVTSTNSDVARSSSSSMSPTPSSEPPMPVGNSENAADITATAATSADSGGSRFKSSLEASPTATKASAAGSPAAAAAASTVSAPTMRRGFFNRGNKTSMSSAASAPSADVSICSAAVPSASGPCPSSGDTNGDASAGSSTDVLSARGIGSNAAVAWSQERDRRASELKDLRAELAAEEQRTAALRQRGAAKAAAAREGLLTGLKGLNVDFTATVDAWNDWNRKQSRSQEDCAESLEAVATCVVPEVRGTIEEARSWNDAQQRKYLDFATEVATVRELAFREQRAVKDTSKQHGGDIRNVTKQLGEIKAAAKSLREDVKTVVAKSEAAVNSKPDFNEASNVAQAAKAFQALPPSVKLAAFAGDATVLKVAALSTMLGALSAVAFLGESFNMMQCRFVCTAMLR
eukprot:TRINITY_DN20638_c0_g1_i1.p1 TRINITY_DN20638_c0_g1~~TRINITY_DN20638_c0_g1_i1.p1  ORF type:complete len:603 (+),score=132.68 TRINITY_DN20638_c0_g1_i1:27-1811(+)